MKGVSKRVVEVHNPDSLYFDKAIFYLKPNLSELSPALLRSEVNGCIRTYSPQRPRRRLSLGLRIVLLVLLSVGTVALGYYLGTLDVIALQN